MAGAPSFSNLKKKRGWFNYGKNGWPGFSNLKKKWLGQGFQIWKKMAGPGFSNLKIHPKFFKFEKKAWVVQCTSALCRGGPWSGLPVPSPPVPAGWLLVGGGCVAKFSLFLELRFLLVFALFGSNCGPQSWPTTARNLSNLKTRRFAEQYPI